MTTFCQCLQLGAVTIASAGAVASVSISMHLASPARHERSTCRIVRNTFRPRHFLRAVGSRRAHGVENGALDGGRVMAGPVGVGPACLFALDRPPWRGGMRDAAFPLCLLSTRRKCVELSDAGGVCDSIDEFLVSRGARATRETNHGLDAKKSLGASARARRGI